jgi:release factor glutamine methyltransferase
MVYLPREDSYLLQKWVEKFAKGMVLDVGTGTGIQAFAAAPLAKQVIAVDVNPDAIEYCNNAMLVSELQNIEFRISDLFSNVTEKFDLIIFNPPYLPESKFDREKDTTGGREGWETIAKFLKEAKSHLNPGGKILMIFSSLTNRDKILEIAKEHSYKPNQLEKRHYGFEDLFVYAFSQD